MEDFVEFIRCLAWFIVIVVCMDIGWTVIVSAKNTYQHHAAQDRDDARQRAECIAHPPPMDNNPLHDVDRFLCNYVANR